MSRDRILPIEILETFIKLVILKKKWCWLSNPCHSQATTWGYLFSAWTLHLTQGNSHTWPTMNLHTCKYSHLDQICMMHQQHMSRDEILTTEMFKKVQTKCSNRDKTIMNMMIIKKEWCMPWAVKPLSHQATTHGHFVFPMNLTPSPM